MQYCREEVGNPCLPHIRQEEDELPPWLRKEKMQKLVNAEGGDGLPFGMYLLGSALVAIAAVSSL